MTAPLPCRARAAGEGRGRACWRRRRPPRRTPPSSPPPTCSSSARPRSSPPTPPTSTRPRPAGMEPGPLDRLRLTDARLEGMADGLRQVAALPDPVGEVLDGWVRPNGLADRSGCGCRSAWSRSSTRTGPTSPATPPGSASSRATPRSCGARRRALRSNLADRRGAARRRSPRPACPSDAVVLVEDTAHEAAVEVMQLTRRRRLPDPAWRPVADPERSATTPPCPSIIDGDGNCHVYVDASADLDMALDIVRQRQDAAAERVQRGRVAGRARGGRRRVPARGRRRARASRASSWSATTAPARAVAGDGRGHRRRLRPRVPRPEADASRSCRRSTPPSTTSTGSAPATPRRSSPRDLDAARPLHRTRSTPPRWSSTRRPASPTARSSASAPRSASRTQKLHARGPMGLRELTTYKYVVWGDGQIRG